MPLVDLQILVGAPMTTIQSSLLWGDPGVDVERKFCSRFLFGEKGLVFERSTPI
jgi:hypothetical protein